MAAVFFFVFGLGYFIDTLTTQSLQTAIGGTYNLPGGPAAVLSLFGIIISWWWLLPPGTILIFSYLLGALSLGLSAVHHACFLGLSQFRDFWSITNIIYLISGILFILSGWLRRKASRVY